MSRRSDTIDILPGSRVVRRGRQWRAGIYAGAGQWRTAAPARAEASNPATAVQRAFGAAWLAILNAQAGGGAGQLALRPCD